MDGISIAETVPPQTEDSSLGLSNGSTALMIHSEEDSRVDLRANREEDAHPLTDFELELEEEDYEDIFKDDFKDNFKGEMFDTEEQKESKENGTDTKPEDATVIEYPYLTRWAPGRALFGFFETCVPAGGLLSSVFVLLSATLGASSLAMPFAFKQCGLVITILLMVRFLLLCSYSHTVFSFYYYYCSLSLSLQHLTSLYHFSLLSCCV